MVVQMIPEPTGVEPAQRRKRDTEEPRFNNNGQQRKRGQREPCRTTMNRTTYPIKMLHAPKKTDETGEMKWHYETRISTELDVKPDHYGIATENALKRQILPVPFAAMKNRQHGKNVDKSNMRTIRSEIKTIAK
ncbi:hypothetical protein ALC53_04160 [Atta colombica]|uniref:Uncharacterized protein n=1 Tax=Atta colombica TaxID=520822 RepID=A0A195BM47_9HYME|nr:hypothetical protein ALC53_04160 [Atta colombica]